MTSAKIAVIVLTYNRAHTIGACLDSLVAQTDKDFSVIVVDDDSTDATIDIVNKYKNKLQIKTLHNGSHNIPVGRNIGLKSVKKGIAAFLDSDDAAYPNWIETIRTSFDHNLGLAAISGDEHVTYRTKFARAIAHNDETMRKLFNGGILNFATCNCAINRDIIPDYYFNEFFKNGEDIEFAARLEKTHSWQFVPELRIKHSTRDKVSQYIKQMYDFGIWKMYFSYRNHVYRAVDFVPLAVSVVCILFAIIDLWLLLGTLLLPLLETIVSIFTTRAPATLWLRMLLAWSIKNTMWNLGLLVSAYHLLTRPQLRNKLREDI